MEKFVSGLRNVLFQLGRYVPVAALLYVLEGETLTVGEYLGIIVVTSLAAFAMVALGTILVGAEYKSDPNDSELTAWAMLRNIVVVMIVAYIWVGY